jgi:hypothetical protein
MTSIELFTVLLPPPIQLEIFCFDSWLAEDGLEGAGENFVEIADNPPWPKIFNSK